MGYDIGELQQSLRAILGIDHAWAIALVGVGNLGTALLSYPASAQGLHRRAFDSGATKHGRRLGNVVVRPLEDLAEAVQEQHLSMAILAVPAGEAQNVVDTVVGAGIKGILSFAPVKLQVPQGVFLEGRPLHRDRVPLLPPHQLLTPRGRGPSPRPAGAVDQRRTRRIESGQRVLHPQQLVDRAEAQLAQHGAPWRGAG